MESTIIGGVFTISVKDKNSNKYNNRKVEVIKEIDEEHYEVKDLSSGETFNAKKTFYDNLFKSNHNRKILAKHTKGTIQTYNLK